jgi:septation ring formation regulator EzrA
MNIIELQTHVKKLESLIESISQRYDEFLVEIGKKDEMVGNMLNGLEKKLEQFEQKLGGKKDASNPTRKKTSK